MDVILGYSSEINREYIKKQLKAHDSANESAYLIVPEQFTMESDLALFDTLGKESIFDIRVYSFTLLSREIKERLGKEKRVPISEIGRAMYLRNLILENKEKLHIFTDIFSSGMIEKVLEIFEKLRMEQYSSDDLKDLVNGPLNDLFRLKLEDIILLYELYNEEISQFYLDTPQKLIYLKENIGEALWLKESHFYIDGFLTMSRLEYEILFALEELGAKVSFSLVLPEEVLANPLHKDRLVFETSLLCYRNLERFSKDKLVHIALEDNTVGILEDKVGDLFSFRQTEVKEKPKNLTLVQGISTEDEVHEVLSFIRQKVSDAGYRYSDFVLSVTDKSEYFPILKRLAPSYEIPIFLGERKRALENPLAKYLSQALSLITYNLKMIEVIAFVKSNFFALEKEKIFLFENYVRRRHFRGRRYFELDNFLFDETFYQDKREHVQTYYQKEANSAYQVASALKERIETFYEETREKKTVREFATSVYTFLNKASFLEALASWESKGSLNLLEENEAVLKGIMFLLDEMVASLGNVTLAFQDFANLFLESLKELRVGILPPTKDKVLVGELGHIRSSEVKWQGIIGLSDLYYPKNHSKNSLFLSKEEAYLKEKGLEPLSSSELKRAEERLSLYDTLTKGREGLYLSYALKNKGLENMNETYFLKRLKEQYKDLEIKSSHNISSEMLVYSPQRAIVQTMNTLRAYYKGEVGNDSANYFYSLYHNILAKDDKKAKFLCLLAKDDKKTIFLGKNLAKNLYVNFCYPRMKMSISQLEKYKACPFAHFVRYGLRPKENIDYNLEKRELGTFIHDGIEAFGKYITAHPNELDTLNESKLREILQATLTKNRNKNFEKNRLSFKRNAYFLHRSEENLYKVITGIVDQLKNSQFRQVGQEVHFGQNGDLPALVINFLDQTIALEGFIDRLDVAMIDEDEKVIVIDYKTGRKNIEFTKLLDGLDLQLLLYLEAASKERSRASGAFYLHLTDQLLEVDFRDKEKLIEAFQKSLLLDGLVINDEKILRAIDKDYDSNARKVLRFKGRSTAISEKENVLSKEQFDFLLNNAKLVAKEALEQMYEGNISVYPYYLKDEDTACDFCAYKAICTFEGDSREAWRQVDNKRTLAEITVGEEDV